MENLLDFDLQNFGVDSGRFLNYSICELFQNKSNQCPNEIAAVFGEFKITYAELNRKSTILAYYLKSWGVGPEKIVGLSTNYDVNLLIGIFGILKAGGAYLPLDPTYPKERLKFMMEDADPIFILASSNLVDNFKDCINSTVSFDHFEWDKFTEVDVDVINQSLDQPKPDHLAYVIYTSGSTGKPKGIMIDHKSFPHFATSHIEYYPSKIRGLVTGSISFDISTLTIFHVLISGGTLYFSEDLSIIDPDQIIKIITEENVNFLVCTPSFYLLLLQRFHFLPSLKAVSVAGEDIPKNLPILHKQLASSAILYNEYAPSECACGATLAKIYDPEKQEIEAISIGKPLPDTSICLLNEDLQEVPFGAKGEIFISGPGLARGYLNHPLLTEQKFLSIKLPGKNSIRFYRTGDFGRFLPKGDLEFLGRKDHQVKIRGYRIELGEIEHLLCSHLNVNEAVVVVKEEKNEHKRLIAYISVNTDQNISETLSTYLATLLPKYMVPSGFIVVKKWPRSCNGKIDRAALLNLPLQALPRSTVEKSLTSLEKALCQAFREVLGREIYEINTNFQDLGIDSLQIINIQTHLHTFFNFEVSVTDLFRYPTISKLAAHLSFTQTENNRFLENEERIKKQKLAFQRFRKFSKEILT